MKKLTLKIMSGVLAAVIAAGVLGACDNNGTGDETTGDEKGNEPMEELLDGGVIPRAYDSEEFGGKAVKSLKIEGTDISEYTIVYPSETEYPAEKTAANELAAYIKKATGAELAVKDDTAEKSAHEILIGHTNRENDVDRSDLGSDGFVIQTSGSDLIITGDGKRGTIYGVYEFCEKYLGWRFLTEDCEVIYPADEINIVAVNDRQVPKFLFRDAYWDLYFPREDGDNISVKRRLTSGFGDSHGITEEYGGMIRYAGRPCHTMDMFTDCAERGQPCLSDPANVEAAIAHVRKMLEENPDAEIVSISQNDNGDYCKCEKCAAVDEEEGSQAGTMIRFVNQVADAIKDEYPNVMIHTFAYQYTRQAPKITKPASNVIVQLCTIERCINHALGDPDCPTNAAIVKDIEDWSEITDHIMIWDYLLNWNIKQLVQSPNLDVLCKDNEFLSRYSVWGVFAQGVYNSTDVGFNALRAYLSSRTLWNPYMSEEEYQEAMNDFLKGYYGDGWRYIRNYLDYYVACGDAKDEIISNSDPWIAFSMEDVNAKKDEITDWFTKAKSMAENDLMKDHIRRCEIHFLIHLYSVEYYELSDLYFENKEEYDRQTPIWEEKNSELMKEIIDRGIATSEHEKDNIRKYNATRGKLPIL